MTHSDPDALAMMAMGESDLPEHELRHLEECAECRSDLRSLRRVADIARSGRVDESLARPDARVWSRIAAETGVDSTLDAAATERVSAAKSTTGRPPSSVRVRRRRRSVRTAVLAGAALVLIGTITAAVVLVQRGQPDLIGQAVLGPVPGAPGVTGRAVVEQGGDGIRAVTVAIDEPDAASSGSFREVWLLSSDFDQLVSLGVLDGREGRYVIPDGVHLAQYPVVDVSLEPLDGDPEHSGDSIARGTLDP